MNAHRSVATVLGLMTLAALPMRAGAAGVVPLFDISNASASPFPSNRFTTPDSRHLTGLRVNLAKPSCSLQPSDCADVDVLNTLDGFNLQPRLSIPFSGQINPATVDSSTVFLVSLGDVTRPLHGFGQVTGINQVVWDPATKNLHVESDALLEEHTKYALIVTDGIRDAIGDPIQVGSFNQYRGLAGLLTRDLALRSYRADVLLAILVARVPVRRIVAASVFTTQSARALLVKIGRQIRQTVPAPAAFDLGPAGARTVFPLVSISGIPWFRQIGSARFTLSQLPLAALTVFPGAVETLAFGRFSSPDYEAAQGVIPAVGTRTGVPVVQSTNDVYFTLFLPTGTPPPTGWPVAIFGHDLADSKEGAVFTVAASMAAEEIATIAINAVGHGGGPQSALVVVRPGFPDLSLFTGGRGIDQDGDGSIDSTEGLEAAPPQLIIGSRDGIRQTAVDLMQLVRVIEAGGIDVDDDSVSDLDGARLYYFGQGLGGVYGTILLGIDPDLAAGVVNAAGGALVDVNRLGALRGIVTAALDNRTPSLLNAAPGFNENIPLRNQPAVTNAVAGALAIQQVIENTEWVSQSGNAVAHAPLLRKEPLNGAPPKPVIVQIAKGDKTVPNPTATALVRAGALADRVTYFRNDLAFAANWAVPKNPHALLTSIANPAIFSFAFAAQNQIATFFSSDGAVTVDPDGMGPFFETPITLPLPEDLSFIP